MDEPEWANVKLPQDRFPGHQLLLGAEGEAEARAAWTRSIPELLRTFEKLGVPMNERAALAGVAVDVIFDSVSVTTTYKQKLAEVGIIFCSISEAVQQPPRTGPQVPRHGRAERRQLLRRTELGGLHRRLVLLHPEGRQVPDGAVDLFSHQHRGVRASSSAR